MHALLTGFSRMASLNSSQRHFGSTASNLRKLKSILNASLVGSNESVILTNQTVLNILNTQMLLLYGFEDFYAFFSTCSTLFSARPPLPQTVMNPTLSLIERMKVVGTDVERRKSNLPDRFFSHFYFGPDKNSTSVSSLRHDESHVRVTTLAGETVGAIAADAQ